MIAMAKLKLDILIKLIMCYKASQLYQDREEQSSKNELIIKRSIIKRLVNLVQPQGY